MASELHYNISGTVRHLGLPVAGVTVLLYEPAHGIFRAKTLIAEQRTGQRGDFNFPVAAGLYTLEIVPDGSTRFVKQTIAPMDVSANTNLNISLSTGFIVQGQVSTVHGAASQSLITALGIEPSGFRAAAVADDSGKFSLVLPRGKYYLIPTWREPLECAASKHADVPFCNASYELIDLERDLNVPLNLNELVLINGQIVDKSGVAVPGTEVWFRPTLAPDDPLCGEFSNWVKTCSSPSGSFLCLLKPGDFEVVLTPPVSTSFCQMSFRSLPIGHDNQPKFQLEDGVRLRGKVAFQNALQPGSTVKLRSRDGKLAYSGFTDESGRFSFGVPAGNYELTVIPKRDRRRRQGEKASAPWSRPVVVGGGETQVDIELGQASFVLGRVVDPKGRTKSGVTVAACPDRGDVDLEDMKNPLTTWTSDEAGRFRLTVTTGKYWVYIAGDPSTAQRVEIGSDPVNLEFIWQGSVKLRFEVAGEDGEPLARCRISWKPYGKDDEASSGGEPRASMSDGGVAFTADDGSCELIVKPNVYSFFFEPNEHGFHDSREIRQLSILSDMVRKIKLPLRAEASGAQLTLDFSPNSAGE